MVLMTNYSPIFLWIVKSEDSKKDYFTELSYIDVLFFGMGLKFLSTRTRKFKEFNIDAHVQSLNQTPIVIFPEVKFKVIKGNKN